MIKTLSTLAVLGIMSFSNETQDAPGASFTWTLQSVSDQSPLTSAFLTEKASDILLPSEVSKQWDCVVSRISQDKIGVSRDISCIQKLPSNSTGVIVGFRATAACRLDGQPSSAMTASITLQAFDLTGQKPVEYNIRLGLTCSKPV